MSVVEGFPPSRAECSGYAAKPVLPRRGWCMHRPLARMSVPASLPRTRRYAFFRPQASAPRRH